MATIKLPGIQRHKSLKEALASATAQASEQHEQVVSQFRKASRERKDVWSTPNNSNSLFQPKT